MNEPVAEHERFGRDVMQSALRSKDALKNAGYVDVDVRHDADEGIRISFAVVCDPPEHLEMMADTTHHKDPMRLLDKVQLLGEEPEWSRLVNLVPEGTKNPYRWLVNQLHPDKHPEHARLKEFEAAFRVVDGLRPE